MLLLKVGGGNKGIGIHGTHLGPGIHIRYGHSDEARQTIPWIEYNAPDGKTVYRAEGAAADGKGLKMREMDCMDCHNRPSHTYKLPERAVDEAMFAGDLSADLPFAKKKAIEILRREYAAGTHRPMPYPLRSKRFTARTTDRFIRSGGRKCNVPRATYWQSSTGMSSPT